jgi:hypothetical protein
MDFRPLAMKLTAIFIFVILSFVLALPPQKKPIAHNEDKKEPLPPPTDSDSWVCDLLLIRTKMAYLYLVLNHFK